MTNDPGRMGKRGMRGRRGFSRRLRDAGAHAAGPGFMPGGRKYQAFVCGSRASKAASTWQMLPPRTKVCQTAW